MKVLQNSCKFGQIQRARQVPLLPPLPTAFIKFETSIPKRQLLLAPAANVRPNLPPPPHPIYQPSPYHPPPLSPVI
jgi:hypothetical protein